MKRWGLVAAVAVVAALTFVWYLGSPLRSTPGFFLDESSIAYNAYLIAQTGVDEHGARMPVYFAAFGEYKNPVYIYLLAAVFKVVGPSILAARALSIVLGFLAAVVLSLLVRDRTARAFTFFAALATPWLFEISRLVFEVAAFPLAMAFALWCVFREKHPVLCGLAFALVTYTYTAGRLIGPMMALALLLAIPWRRALIAWAAYAVLLIPALLNFHAVAARVEQVGVTGFSYFAAFSPQFLFVTGDPNARHHIPFGGMLLVTVALLALAGIGAAIRRREPFDRYLLAMLVVAPIPGALSDEGPHALRLITVGVLLVVFAGIGMSALAAIPRESLRAALTIALFLALAAEGLAFRAQFRELGPMRLIEFDTGFPSVFARLQPPVCVENNPYYIHSYWYGVLRGIDRAQLPRYDEGAEPLGRVCMGTAPVCGTCKVLMDVRWFVAYRRE